MSEANTYGGWFTDRPAATGTPLSLIRLVGWATVAALACTGGEIARDRFQRTTISEQHAASIAEIAEIDDVRSPKNDLARIREVFHPAVSDLASTFGVSRQSVYNWGNGERVADGNVAKLKDLALAADVFAHEGIAVNAALLKRKFANGHTLLEIAQSGESAREAALLLVQIHKLEAAQRERISSRFALRKRTSATADFDLPAASDKV